MGLDIAELVMEFEDEFGIEIPEEARIHTVGEMAGYLWERVHHAMNVPCPSHAAFLRVRAELVKTLNVPRREIRPSTPLASLMARGDLRTTWRHLEGEFGVPGLQWSRKRWLWVCGLTLLAAVGAVSLLAWAAGETPTGIEGWVVAAAYVGMVGAMGLLTAVLAVPGTVIPARLRTVRDLVLPSAFMRAHPGEWTRDAVLKRVKAITSKMLGVPVETIDEPSRFADLAPYG